MRLLRSQKRIDQRGLAYIRPSEKRHLGRPIGLRFRREVRNISRRQKKDRIQPHPSSLPPLASTPITQSRKTSHRKKSTCPKMRAGAIVSSSPNDLLRLNRNPHRRPQTKSHPRLRGNHDIFVPRKGRTRCSRTRAKQTSNQSTLTTASQTTNQSATTCAASNKACGSLPLTRLLFFVLGYTHRCSRDRGQLNPQSACTFEFAPSLRRDHRASHTRSAGKERRAAGAPDRLCKHTGKSIPYLIVARA